MVARKYEIIDTHCHIYPEKILPAAVDATAAFYCEPASHGGTAEELLRAGERAGISRHIVSSVATTPKQVHSIHRFLSSQAAKCPQRLSALGAAHPESPDMPGDIRELQDLGMIGVKIHPDIQGYPVDHPGFHKLYDLCERENLPVLIHTGDGRYDFSNPNRFLPVVQSHPGVTFIGAHFAGWGIWEKAWETMRGQPNLYVDCSSAVCYLSPEVSRKIIRAYGADRVLFGTDYPLHPVEREVELLLGLGLSEEENRQILSENAKKVFKLP